MKTLITIVTVSFNAVHGIEKTILSVVNQTYENIEYIIIDGGSTDGTVDVIKKYADHITYWVSEPDKGIYDAMNKGIEKATGEWINFMNAGDIFLESQTLSNFVSYLDGSISILRGNIIRVYNRFKVKSYGVTNQMPSIIDMIHNTFHHQACLIRRSLFDEIGFYDTNYYLCADWKFFFDSVVLHHVKSRYVNISVALFVMDGTSSSNVKKCIDEHKRYLRKVYGEELYLMFEELSLYRKSFVCHLYYLLRRNLVEHLSPVAFNRILNFKRICCSLLGLRVN